MGITHAVLAVILSSNSYKATAHSISSKKPSRVDIPYADDDSERLESLSLGCHCDKIFPLSSLHAMISRSHLQLSSHPACLEGRGDLGINNRKAKHGPDARLRATLIAEMTLVIGPWIDDVSHVVPLLSTTNLHIPSSDNKHETILSHQSALANCTRQENSRLTH
jgi:hypothetical protein